MAERKKGGRKKGQRAKLTPREERFAKERAKGKSMAAAAKAAGVSSPRSARQRGYEWNLKPEIRALIRKLVDMDLTEAKGLLGAKARGASPTKVVTGVGARTEWDMLAATVEVVRVLGGHRQTIEHTGAAGGPIAITLEDMAKLSTEDLEALARIHDKRNE